MSIPGWIERGTRLVCLSLIVCCLLLGGFGALFIASSPDRGLWFTQLGLTLVLGATIAFRDRLGRKKEPMRSPVCVGESTDPTLPPRLPAPSPHVTSMAGQLDQMRTALDRIESKLDQMPKRSATRELASPPYGDEADERSSRARRHRGERPKYPTPRVGSDGRARDLQKATSGTGGDGHSNSARALGQREMMNLADAWRQYREVGQGYFEAQGLRAEIDRCGIAADVVPGSRHGLTDEMLLVCLPDAEDAALLPSFNRSPAELGEWFDLHGGTRGSRIKELVRPARVKVERGVVVLQERGELE